MENVQEQRIMVGYSKIGALLLVMQNCLLVCQCTTNHLYHQVNWYAGVPPIIQELRRDIPAST